MKYICKNIDQRHGMDRCGGAPYAQFELSASNSKLLHEWRYIEQMCARPSKEKDWIMNEFLFGVSEQF